MKQKKNHALALRQFSHAAVNRRIPRHNNLLLTRQTKTSDRQKGQSRLVHSSITETWNRTTRKDLRRPRLTVGKNIALTLSGLSGATSRSYYHAPTYGSKGQAQGHHIKMFNKKAYSQHWRAAEGGT